MRRVRVPEKTVQSHGINLVRSIGGAHYTLGRPSPNDGRVFRGTGQTPGIADVLFWFPPVERNGEFRGAAFLWWEVKAEGGTLSPAQVVFRDRCRQAGALHVDGDLDALIAALVELGRIKRENLPHYRRGVDTPDGE